MAEIREFRAPETAVQKKNFGVEIIKHRFSTAIRILIAVLVVATIIVILRNQYKNQSYTGVKIGARGEKASLSDNSYLVSKGRIITYSKNGISSTDGTGKVLWNMTYEMQNPIVHEAGGLVAVCDYNGHIINVINSTGKEYEIDTNLPIRDFAISKEERVAVILEDTNNSWVNLYDINGNKLVEIKATMSKTGYPLAVTLSDEVMGVSYFYVDGNKMRSSVTFYNFGGIGENTPDHIVSSYDYADAVVPLLAFLDTENVFALGDSRLMFYAGAKKPVSTADTILSEKILGAYYGDTNIGLILYDTTGEHKYRLDIYQNNGKLKSSYAFDMDFKDILIQNNQILIYNEKKCIILNSDGQEKFSGEFPEGVLCLTTTESNKKYIAVTKDAIETFVFE